MNPSRRSTELSAFGARYADSPRRSFSMRATSELRLLQGSEPPPEEATADRQSDGTSTPTAFSELEAFVRRELKLREDLQRKLDAYERQAGAGGEPPAAAKEAEK